MAMMMPETARAPIIPMSSVLMEAIMAKPDAPPTSAAKSTPKKPPHCESMVFTKYWKVR